MRLLYHYSLSPHCRKVRIFMMEKHLQFKTIDEPIWEKRAELYSLNPAQTVPVLVEENGKALCDSLVICEYLDETYEVGSLIGGGPFQKAEIRRLSQWFDKKFYEDVTGVILEEKIYKQLFHRGEPNSQRIRWACDNIKYHCDYISSLVERRNAMAGDDLSLADICAASHLSCLDYLGMIDWKDYDMVYQWYVRLKSRPSFRQILKDRHGSIPPAPHYPVLDF